MSVLVTYWFLVILMLVGIVGAFVPGIPGASLILIGVVIWGIIKGFAGITIPLTVAVLVLVFSVLVDFLATYWGAQKVGASSWGQIGGMVGLALGFLGFLPALPIGGPLLGMLLGPMIGAFIGEFLYRKDLQLQPRAELSFKVGVAIVIGTFVGKILQGLLAITAVVVFILSTWTSVGG